MKQLHSLTINKKETNLDFLVGKKIVITKFIFNRCIKHSKLIFKQVDNITGNSYEMGMLANFPFSITKKINIMEFDREYCLNESCNSSVFFKGFKKSDEVTIHFKIIAITYKNKKKQNNNGEK